MTKDIGITILEVDTFIRKFDRSAFLICDYFQAVALSVCLSVCLPDRQTDK
jgi:hypothetical protein